MVFEHIEKLKSEYTDKYVAVDGAVLELKRFQGQTGQVRTVNMSGRALVEFDGDNNIGWYDIDVDFLKVVDPPPPVEKAKAKPKAAAAKAPAKKAAAAKSAPAKPAAQASGKMSVEEMMAAARGEKSGGAAAPAKPAAAAQPAAAKAPAGKLDPSQMSVEQMLAAARGEKSGGAAATTATPDNADSADERLAGIAQALAEARIADDQGGGPAQPAAATPAAAPATGAAKLDPKQMSVEQMLAAARGEKSGGAATQTETTESPESAADQSAVDQSTVEEVAEQAAAADAEPEVEDVDEGADAGPRSDLTDTADVIAYCRQADGGS